MDFRIVNTETLLKNFKPYHESMDLINEEKKKFTDRVDSIRNEMEGLVKSSQLILDDKSTQSKKERFNELQTEAVELENEFRQMISKMQNEELDKNFKDITDITQEWAVNNDVKHVFNALQMAYTDGTADCTDEIIELIKERNLYKEFTEET